MNPILDGMNEIASQISLCQRCNLHLSRIKSVPGEGNIATKILFIGEAPGANENQTGRPFVGQAGNFLNELLGMAQVKRQEVFITNVIKCRPPQNRDPMPEELSACSHYLEEQIRLINPLIIVTLGRFSMARYFPLQRISAIHGQGKWVGDQIVVPMFHPAAALHQPNLRDSILHDFSILPQYIQEAQEKLGHNLALTEEKSAETVDIAEPETHAPDGEQLSLF